VPEFGAKTSSVCWVYFFSENHALWVCSETMALPVMVLSFLWSNGPPWCDLLKIHTCNAYILWQQPLRDWSLSIGLGQGVLDDWSSENHRCGYLPLHGPWEKRSGTSFLAFKTRSSISDQYSTTPLLQAPFEGAPN
jgi:hypothetical protein